MSDLERLILEELQRHEAQPSFNLRCKCGHIEKTVSEIGDFERHVSAEIASALSGAGLVTNAEIGETKPSPVLLREAGFGRVGSRPTVPLRPADMPEDERHASWCRGDHEGRCRRGRLTGTEKQAAL